MALEKYGFDIPNEWRVNKNEFYKIDSPNNLTEDDKFHYLYSEEDMLLIENGDYHLDLGWYGNEEGCYKIHFFRGNWLVGELLEKYSSNSSLLIAQRIREILTAYVKGEYNNINGYIVDENDKNNRSNFGDLESYEPRINKNR